MLMGLLALGVVAGKIKTANGTVPLSSRVKIRLMNNRGRRLRFGKVENKKVVIVMTGLSMAMQILNSKSEMSLFLSIGLTPAFGIGQRFGDGPEHELAFESNGDDTREFGYLEFSGYNNVSQNGEGLRNFLNRVWYQREEVFPIDGVPEVRQHAFWVPVDQSYYGLSVKITDLKLGTCVNSSTCLPRSPMVVRVERGVTANVFVDNKAYREFLRSKFNATPIDMESAGVALVCHQLDMPFIAFRSLSDLAGGGSSLSNEASTFASLAAQNAVDSMIKFISLLAS
ncbi:hypothetical protein NL676_035752 [Syzygium grande]|nr:hypothetical protein NL676_035752 [Syzygium grande]